VRKGGKAVEEREGGQRGEGREGSKGKGGRAVGGREGGQWGEGREGSGGGGAFRGREGGQRTCVGKKHSPKPTVMASALPPSFAVLISRALEKSHILTAVVSMDPLALSGSISRILSGFRSR
jgi:hypothetical protein